MANVYSAEIRVQYAGIVASNKLYYFQAQAPDPPANGAADLLDAIINPASAQPLRFWYQNLMVEDAFIACVIVQLAATDVATPFSRVVAANLMIPGLNVGDGAPPFLCATFGITSAKPRPSDPTKGGTPNNFYMTGIPESLIEGPNFAESYMTRVDTWQPNLVSPNSNAASVPGVYILAKKNDPIPPTDPLEIADFTSIQGLLRPFYPTVKNSRKTTICN